MRLSSYLLALCIALSGCDSTGPTAPEAPSSTTSLTTASNTIDEADEAASLTELARTFAVALGSSPAVRNEVRRDLADSRYTAEHKLHLQNHLVAQADRGKGKLLAAMAEETGRTKAEVLALAQSVRELEFYLPVAAHRTRWRGGKDMVVAALLDNEEEAPVGFGLGGQPVALSSEAPPDIPALSLVPVETDFAAPLPASVTNTNDAGGAAIGTYAVGKAKAPAALGPTQVGTTSFEDPCEDPNAILPPECGGGSGSGGGTSPPGLYYTGADLAFVGEAWVRGEPEIEVHVMPYFDPDNYSYGGSLFTSTTNTSSCQAGNGQSGLRDFDQNDESWSGNALILDEGQLGDFTLIDADGRPIYTYVVTLWEDDYRECDLQTNIDVSNHISAIATGPALFFGALAAYTVDAYPGNWSGVLGLAAIAAGTAVAVSNSAWRFFHTNDEFLGVVVGPAGERTAPTTGTFTLIVNSSGQQNGTISLSTR